MIFLISYSKGGAPSRTLAADPCSFYIILFLSSKNKFTLILLLLSKYHHTLSEIVDVVTFNTSHQRRRELHYVSNTMCRKSESLNYLDNLSPNLHLEIRDRVKFHRV